MNHQNDVDKIQIITSTVANVDVVINYLLQNGTKGNHYIKISSATTTDVDITNADAPVTIELLSIKNTHGSTSNTITVQKYFNADSYQEFKVCSIASIAKLV